MPEFQEGWRLVFIAGTGRKKVPEGQPSVDFGDHENENEDSILPTMRHPSFFQAYIRMPVVVVVIDCMSVEEVVLEGLVIL
jgi:hypothetical protein